MPLLDLANELLFCITENLESEGYINSLAQVNRHLYRLLNPYLYCLNIRQSGCSALLWAALDGQTGTAQRLLEEADEQVTSDDPFYISLCLAAEKGHIEIVQLLINKGVNVKYQSPNICNGDVEYNSTFALEAASEGGQEEVVQLLLNKGANVNAQSTHWSINQEQFYYSNALYAASEGGYERIVKQLLDHGADLMQGGYYGNALQAAAAGGHEQTVKLLLDARGADVNARGQYYWKWWCEFLDSNALCIASEYGYEQIVKLLLDRGADVNLQGGPYGNALVAASANGYGQVVRLLLEKGAMVNALGREPTMDIDVYIEISALQAASREGHKQVVDMLLARGAEGSMQHD
ncbi:hypothetical protein OPT61_g2411 [Boeremia exigua]|uniref:Uncharacterized protein n=1 Tax=Boeremia exigua TaxID=749465 RepID=A0ACC2ILV1_9PLEO|nr:hypothetical protein OPT61_g2411 [Boeremia exigua]